MPNPITVLIHLTGLLVVVPPNGGGDMTHIVMAEATGIPAHLGRIGFEAPNRAGLCKEHKRGVCYVDMGVWSLDPVGAGGTIPMPKIQQLPSGLIDLTHGSGNQHRVDTSALGNREIASFVSGRPATDPAPCSLADWSYRAVGAASPRAVAVANVVSWEMDLPQPRLQLVFRRRTAQSDTAIVTLDFSGDPVEIVVAYLPAGDLNRLITGTPNQPQGYLPGTRAEHFDALYNPLGVPPGDRRRIPEFIRPTRWQPCPARMHPRTKALERAKDGIDTHSCLLAAAQAR